jgi:aminopeptidase-like protein
MRAHDDEWVDAHEAGARMYALARDLFPLCRSITGTGLRQTIHRIAQIIPLEVHEVPSGTPVLDWTVPDEWTIRGARIERMDGSVLVDFSENNLHVVSYSLPVDDVLSREDLAGHVHTLPNQPELIPYRTAYYAKTWGFCLQHQRWQAMTDPRYRVVIDSELAPGSLTYGELLVPGERSEEILISAHCCHPSLANDNLSAIAVAVELARRALRRKPRLSFRFIFAPATIGIIAWLARNEQAIKRIKAGLVLTCLGDPGGFHYKRSRRDTAEIDRIVRCVLKDRSVSLTELPFTPFGYDERQFGSPGYDLPVGCFTRSPARSFPQYHTSADNLDLLSPDTLAQSLSVLSDVLEALDQDVVYIRRDGRGEPQLGRRQLYRQVSGQRETGGAAQEALLWVLNLADGRHSLLDMAERSSLPLWQLRDAARVAVDAELIDEAA